MAELELWCGVISQLGFPIFVAMLLLLRTDRMHAENIRAMSNLTQELALNRQLLEHLMQERK